MAKYSCPLCDGTGFVSKEKKDEYDNLKAGKIQEVVIANKPVNSESDSDFNVLKSELDNIRNQNSELISQNELLENQVSEVQTQNVLLQTDLELARQKNESNELVFASIKEKSENLEREVKKLQEQLLIWEVDKGLKKKTTTSFSWFKKH
jgi:chromosome segregation ATPase